MLEATTSTLPGEELCVKEDSGENMSYADARAIAEKSVCASEGGLKDTHWCNQFTGTWWIDTSITKPGCSPTCVIDVANKTAVIDWMCTGGSGGSNAVTTSTRSSTVTTLYLPAPTTEPDRITPTTFPDSGENTPQSTNLPYTPENPPQGAVLLSLTGSGFTSQYSGYKFKIESMVFESEYNISGILLYVQKPDGTIVEAEMGYDECHKDYYDAKVDDVVLRLWYASERGIEDDAQVYAWNYKTTPVIKSRKPPEKPNSGATLISDVTSEGFTSEYNGYKFKVDHLQYSSEFHPFILVLDVQKPDGTISTLAVKEGSSARIDNINVASPFCGYVKEYAATMYAAIWAWEGADSTVDTTPQDEIYPLTYTPDKPPQGSTPLDLGGESGVDEYNGYKFSVERLIYSSEYEISGVVLDVQKPDDTDVVVRLGYDECHKTYYDAQVDDVVLRLVSAHTYAQYQVARVYAWSYKSIPVMKKQNPSREAQLWCNTFAGSYQ